MGFTAMVSDSTAGLQPAYTEAHQVKIVPLYIKMGDTLLREGVELDASDFYQRLPHTNPLPTTSQPSVGDFEVAYQEVVDRGADKIISVHLSAGISGTINSATQAAKQFPTVQIDILDTRCASASHYFAVQAGVSALEAGASHSEAVNAVQRVIDAQRTIFAVDTLEYLYKGGRIGGAAALFGSLLQMKPLLHFKEGKIDALERVRSSNRALSRMVEVLVDWMGSAEPLRVMIMQSNCEERAQQAEALLRPALNVARLETLLLTAVLGAHVGPGTVGVCCCPAALCGQLDD